MFDYLPAKTVDANNVASTIVFKEICFIKKKFKKKEKELSFGFPFGI
jgi:hypothetical protein